MLRRKRQPENMALLGGSLALMGVEEGKQRKHRSGAFSTTLV
jgi:hypothetical protein